MLFDPVHSEIFNIQHQSQLSFFLCASSICVHPCNELLWLSFSTSNQFLEKGGKKHPKTDNKCGEGSREQSIEEQKRELGLFRKEEGSEETLSLSMTT